MVANKKSVEKINLILDDTHKMTAAVAEPVEEASEFLVGLKKGVKFIRNITRLVSEENYKDKKSSGDKKEEEYQEPEKKEKAKRKRFFLKAGKSLN